MRRRMPAEWERHRATWMAFPHAHDTWPGCLEEAQAEFAHAVRALAGFERVEVLVANAALEQIARATFARELEDGRVRLHRVASDDVWMRDIAPTFVYEASDRVAVDWTFNAWGGKYPPWERDAAVGATVAGLAGIRTQRSDLVCEGGALESDGEGTLIVTEPTLVDAARNPGRARDSIEAELRSCLGTELQLWLPRGIEGDDTDGHVDDIARFVGPAQVVCSSAPATDPPNAAALAECRAVLASGRDARGRALRVHDLPLPEEVRSSDGERLPASYANFYIANGCVLVPVFAVPQDDAALALLARLLPDRRVLPIPARNLLRGLGTLHCLTQQEPVPHD